MGQYYKAVINDDDKIEVYNLQVKYEVEPENKWECYNGVKLMEHSWWGNAFCRAFSKKLLTPKRVAWVGDYADEDEIEAMGFPANIWERKDRTIKESDFSIDSVKFLVNHDHKTYINLSEYKQKSNNGGWIIYPVSLLTAIGNGRGGGDYHEDGTCYDEVGSWSGCLIQLTNEVPMHYEKLDIYFVEQ